MICAVKNLCMKSFANQKQLARSTWPEATGMGASIHHAADTEDVTEHLVGCISMVNLLNQHTNQHTLTEWTDGSLLSPRVPLQPANAMSLQTIFSGNTRDSETGSVGSKRVSIRNVCPERLPNGNNRNLIYRPWV